jgi:hypothetical protein
MTYVIFSIGARGSVVVMALCYKPEGRGLKTQWDEIFFFNLPNLSSRTGLGVYSASNINEYQKQKNNVSAEYSAARA